MPDYEPDDTPRPPCADALVAGTVALMTAWAAPCPTCILDADQQRYLLSRKLLANLLLLQQHPALSIGLRQVMAQAHQRWVEVARSCSEVALRLPEHLGRPDDDDTAAAANATPAASALH